MICCNLFAQTPAFRRAEDSIRELIARTARMEKRNSQIVNLLDMAKLSRDSSLFFRLSNEFRQEAKTI